MRILDQAIEEHLFETSSKLTHPQTWEAFEADAIRGFVLFGTGEGAAFCLERYGRRFQILGILDNDPKKQGEEAEELISQAKGILPEGMRVQRPEAIGEDLTQAETILITSIRYWEEIAEQLFEMGVRKLYSLLHMEADLRNRSEEEERDFEEETWAAYAKECMKLPIIQNCVLFGRDECGGHGLQLIKRLAEDNSRGASEEAKLDLIWVSGREDEELPDGVTRIKSSDKKAYIEALETAHVWVFGDMLPEFAIKREGQEYIHVKHWGSLTLKKFYIHLEKHMETPAICRYYRHNSDAMDYCFVGSAFDEETCRSGFDFHKECVYIGSPRTDVLFQEGVREKVFARLGIEEKKHLLLFAPTFRAKNEHTLIGHMRQVDLDFVMLKEALKLRFGGEWMILLRIHPDVAFESRKVERPPFVLDVSAYPDPEELVAASDILISDYSSILFEPAYVGRPVFLYAPDHREYQAKDRELLLDYYSLPFPLTENNEQLKEAIHNFDEDRYQREVKVFLERHQIHEDGKASERGASFIRALASRSVR